jgi:hypothetical protein
MMIMDPIIWKNNHKNCKNYNTNVCPIDDACVGCYHYKLDELICPNCGRRVPNTKFLNKDKKTCRWCKQ